MARQKSTRKTKNKNGLPNGVNQATGVGKWHGFTLQPGMYYGKDERGLWATSGAVGTFKDADGKKTRGIVMFRTGPVTKKMLRFDDARLVWERTCDMGKTARLIDDLVSKNRRELKDNPRKAGDVMVRQKDYRHIPAARQIGREHSKKQTENLRANEAHTRKIVDDVTGLTPEDREIRDVNDPFYTEFANLHYKRENGERIHIMRGTKCVRNEKGELVKKHLHYADPEYKIVVHKNGHEIA